MRLKILFILLFVFGFLLGNSQTMPYKTGVYYSIEEFLDQKPRKTEGLSLNKRTKTDIQMAGGNDYKLLCTDKSISKKELRHRSYVFVENENLYINCGPLKLYPGFAKVISDKENFIFMASIPINPNEFGINRSQLLNVFGTSGGAIGGAKRALLRFPYILNKSTQKITLVTPDNVTEVIDSNESLIKEYKSEDKYDRDNLDVILKYLIAWNESN